MSSQTFAAEYINVNSMSTSESVHSSLCFWPWLMRTFHCMPSRKHVSYHLYVYQLKSLQSIQGQPWHMRAYPYAQKDSVQQHPLFWHRLVAQIKVVSLQLGLLIAIKWWCVINLQHIWLSVFIKRYYNEAYMVICIY